MTGRIFKGRLAAKFNPFDGNYLAEIVEAVALAWTRMQHPAESEIEDRITFRLAGRLANDKRFADLPYEAIAQYWLLGLNGERLGRIDLRFKHRHSQRDYFAFEAKRLHVTYPKGKFSTEYPTYAGSKGMMAFVEEQYSQGFPASGMLAYVMDNQCGKAWNGLSDRIETQRIPLKLVKQSQLINSTLGKSIANAMGGTRLGETHHALKTCRMRMFHLLLPVKYGYKGRR